MSTKLDCLDNSYTSIIFPTARDTIKSTFNLIKTQIDRDIKCREYGRLGGIKSAEKRRLEKGEFVLVIDEKNETNPLKNLVKNIMEGDTKN